MIDLAPHNPYSIALASPIVVASGCAIRELALAQVGAVLTRTTTVHTRHLPPPQWAATPAGLLFSHRPTISVRTLLRDDARRWGRSPVPVWASLLGNGDELLEVLVRLESVEGLAGFVVEIEELALARVVQGLRARTLLPLIICLPLVPEIVSLAQAVADAGADALCLAVPPQGAVMQGETVLTGELYGPAIVPLILQPLTLLRAAMELPLVAQGGIADLATAQAYLRAGANALIVDAARWGDPFAPQRLAMELT